MTLKEIQDAIRTELSGLGVEVTGVEVLDSPAGFNVVLEVGDNVEPPGNLAGSVAGAISGVLSARFAKPISKGMYVRHAKHLSEIVVHDDADVS